MDVLIMKVVWVVIVLGVLMLLIVGGVVVNFWL